MNSSRKVRRLVPLVAAALLAVALLAPAAKAAGSPPLISTSQYKSLVSFIEKLNQMSRTPATAAKKATYEDQLQNKHDAASDKRPRFSLAARRRRRPNRSVRSPSA